MTDEKSASPGDPIDQMFAANAARLDAIEKPLLAQLEVLQSKRGDTYDNGPRTLDEEIMVSHAMCKVVETLIDVRERYC